MHSFLLPGIKLSVLSIVYTERGIRNYHLSYIIEKLQKEENALKIATALARLPALCQCEHSVCKEMRSCTRAKGSLTLLVLCPLPSAVGDGSVATPGLPWHPGHECWSWRWAPRCRCRAGYKAHLWCCPCRSALHLVGYGEFWSAQNTCVSAVLRHTFL